MADSVAFPEIHYAADEVVRSASYRYDNATRGGAPIYVVQQTLGGAAYYDSGDGPADVGAGRAMLFRHLDRGGYGYPEGADEAYRLRYVSFHGGAAAALFDRIRGDFGPVVTMRTDGESAVLLEELVSRFKRRAFADRLQEAELIFRLLVALYREQVADNCDRDPAESGRQFILNHYRSAVNLKQIAARCGVSREHFIRAFGRRYGESPGALLRRLRLEHARSLLVSTRIGVRDVALASGFSTANALCRAYRHAYGVSPGSERA